MVTESITLVLIMVAVVVIKNKRHILSKLISLHFFSAETMCLSELKPLMEYLSIPNH